MFNKILYGKDKKGGFKVWEILVRQCNGMVDLNIYHGKEGGKMQAKETCVLKGYQGRTLYEQAILEAEGKIKKQMDKGYREGKHELEELPLLAMLAADYRKQGHRISYPCYTSDKYDGVRCLAKHKGILGVVLESRTGQLYDVPHITEALSEIMLEGDVLDGEIYLHGEVLQDITSAVKRTDTQAEADKAFKKLDKLTDPSDIALANAAYADAVHIHKLRPKLKFYVFDVPSSKVFDERLSDLQHWIRPSTNEVIEFTEYDVAVDEADMKAKHKDAVARLFEGIMLRNREGLYESGKRSADLQKYKEFLDEEFEITGAHLDKQGGIVFELKNNINDEGFDCVLGSLDWRLKAAGEMELYIGGYMTVQFQSRYKGTLLPQFPTGKVIRSGKLLGGIFIPSE